MTTHVNLDVNSLDLVESEVTVAPVWSWVPLSEKTSIKTIQLNSFRFFHHKLLKIINEPVLIFLNFRVIHYVVINY